MNDAVDSIGKLAHALTEAPITDIVAGVGGEPVHSRWIAIDQAMIDRFATLTNDHNWLHVDPERAAKSPVGSTIAHGFLTLSLIPTMAYEVLPRVQESTMGMNYGLNKVRFMAPVPVGARLRAGAKLMNVEQVAGGVQVTIEVTFECEGATKPSCVAEVIFRYYA